MADFIGNKAEKKGGAIYNAEDVKIGSITGDFMCNFTYEDSGGAIYNKGEIENIKGDFIGNYVEEEYGGA